MKNMIQNGNMLYTLVITEAIWTDSKNIFDNIRNIKITKDDTVRLSSMLDEKITLKLKEEANNLVSIETSKPMSIRDYENNPINLNNKETVFKIEKGGQVILDTLSMDIGLHIK